MEKIQTIIRSRPCRVTGAVKEQTIKDSENVLGFRFPDEYRFFLATFGSLEYNGDVILGLGPSFDNNTVLTTQEERRLSRSFPNNSCVLYSLGIEGLMVLIGSDGRICEWTGDEASLIFDTFGDWLENEFFNYK